MLRSLSRSSAASQSPLWSQIDRQGAAPQLIKATTQCLDCLAKELGVVGHTQASRLVHRMQSNIRSIRNKSKSYHSETDTSVRRFWHTDALPVRRGASAGPVPNEHGSQDPGRTAAAVAQAKDALRAILHRCFAARKDSPLAPSDPSRVDGKGLPIDMRSKRDLDGAGQRGTPSPSRGHAKSTSPIAAAKASDTASPSSLVRTSSAGSGSGTMHSAPQVAPTGSEE